MQLLSSNLNMQNSVVMFTFSLCRWQISFLGKFGPENQKFILKFGPWTNSNMQNSMAMFSFSALYWNYPFFGKFGSKNQNRLKFGTQTNANMQNSMGMFTLLGFGPKYLFSAYLVQKLKFVCSGKNLVPRLIQICRTQWWCSLHRFQAGNTLFWRVLSKNENYQFQHEFDTYCNSNIKNSMVMLALFIF